VTTHYISNSERSKASCLHAWLIQYGLGLVQASKSVAPFRGIAWGGVMDAYHVDGLLPARIHLSEQRGIARGKSGQHSIGDDEKTAEVFDLVEDCLERYHLHWTDSAVASIWGRTIAAEVKLKSRVTKPGASRRSAKTGVLGYLDKIQEDVSGGLWIGEHKFTTTDLALWRQNNGYRPQAITYAWLLREEIRQNTRTIRDLGLQGRTVRGVIYDLTLSKVARPASSFTTIKNGSRMRSTNGVPSTTAKNWAQAVSDNGFALSDYRTTYDDLRQREMLGHWFKREVVPFTDRQIDRAGQELYYTATRVRRLREQCNGLRESVALLEDDPSTMGALVESLLDRLGAEYPRNPNECTGGRFACPYATLCEHGTYPATLYTPRRRDDK
jgi:hypothetical protein